MTNNNTIDNVTIGERIRKVRSELGISRDEFAGLVNISSYYLGQLERGERQMSLPVLANVAQRLHVSLDYLVFGLISDKENNSDSLLNLINRSSRNELELFEKLIKTILPYV